MRDIVRLSQGSPRFATRKVAAHATKIGISSGDLTKRSKVLDVGAWIAHHVVDRLGPLDER